jgi:benzoyl-CoA reductase/2-hydroxyglutaryl-CoA dehydratase subunit BcrC/BadD/HgdB
MLAEDKNFVSAIADRYIRRTVCPAKHFSITSRGDYLVQKVQQSQSDGVIFLLLKFCDPHAFDYPYLRDRLTEIQIPSTLIEIDPQRSFSEQIRTRCEAFIEML